MVSEPENSEAMRYVNSLDDEAKRHYAVAYLAWIRDGQVGNMPDQGPLSLTVVRMVSRTLDRLA
jgi:hypothetical protein